MEAFKAYSLVLYYPISFRALLFYTVPYYTELDYTVPCHTILQTMQINTTMHIRSTYYNMKKYTLRRMVVILWLP